MKIIKIFIFLILLSLPLSGLAQNAEDQLSDQNPQIDSTATEKQTTENDSINSNSNPHNLPVIAVIGMSNEVENEEWKDARVGMGLRIILSQLFFESGHFWMMEEKKEIKEKLNELSTGIWAMNQEDYDFEDDIKEIAQFEPDFVAYGKVYYFGRPRSRASFGPVHMNKNSVKIKVEVALKDMKRGKTIKEKGEGKSSTTAGSAIFQYREDNVELDKTNVGNATKDALAEAVEKIMKEYEKKYKK
jgi:hypothetical protein